MPTKRSNKSNLSAEKASSLELIKPTENIVDGEDISMSHGTPADASTSSFTHSAIPIETTQPSSVQPKRVKFSPVIVWPGDTVTPIVTHRSTDLKIGVGLQASDEIRATTPGVLRFQKPDKYYVESTGKRYTPAMEDPVIGIILDRSADNYRVHINGNQPAILPTLAFEGASKRNKPELEVGDVVYARVAAFEKFMEAELSCKVLSGPTKDWVTGQSLYGQLKKGHITKCSLGLARMLLDPRCAVLEELGRVLPFEIAIGVNGYFWIETTEVSHTILITQTILESEFKSDAATRAFVKFQLQQLRKSRS